jgi:hypothetical protein
VSQRAVFTCDYCGKEHPYALITLNSVDNRLGGPRFPMHFCSFLCAAVKCGDIARQRPVEAMGRYENNDHVL